MSDGLEVKNIGSHDYGQYADDYELNCRPGIQTESCGNKDDLAPEGHEQVHYSRVAPSDLDLDFFPALFDFELIFLLARARLAL